MAKKYLDAPVTSVKDRIVRYKTVGDIILNAPEEVVLVRWEYCDLLIRTGHSYMEVRDKIMERFGVSRMTADKDWSATQDVFAKVRNINKKYDGGIHLDRLKKMIEFYEKQIYELGEDGKRLRTMKELKDIGAVISKLYDSYTYQLNSIPSEAVNSKTIVPAMFMNLTKNTYINTPMEADQALQAADDYLDFENIDHGRTDGPGTDDHDIRDAATPLPDQAG